jgi:hypothetical protein
VAAEALPNLLRQASLLRHREGIKLVARKFDRQSALAWKLTPQTGIFSVGLAPYTIKRMKF